jgi:hypothetical protein
MLTAGAEQVEPRCAAHCDSMIEQVSVAQLRPAVVNDTIYKPVSEDDPAVIKLSEDIADLGVLEPLVITLDNTILSGHRRRVGAKMAGLKVVPVRRHPIRRDDPNFERVLVAFNSQRVKTADESIREEVVRTSPNDAMLDLLEYREAESERIADQAKEAGLRMLDTGGAARRAGVSPAKIGMLNAAIAVLNQYTDYWPLTLRQVHYRLLGRKVLRNSSDPKSTYTNTQASYKDLSDLLTRARLTGAVPWESMHDPTRPQTEWRQWSNVADYMREQMGSFLRTYKRNLLQSQPAYVELVVEKITVQEIAERAARQYLVPVGVGRGYTSASMLAETAKRYRASGKDRFVLLIAGDLDSEGEDVCRAWGASLRDEHRVHDITVVKVGVNPEQVQSYGLAPLPMKTGSSRATGFEATHGANVYELEAFEPDQLQQIIASAICSVLDLDRFEAEKRQEVEDARHLAVWRTKVRGLLAGGAK